MSDQNYFPKRKFEDFEQRRIELMKEIAKAVSQKTGEKFVLKGGTALLLAYDLPRFSTDLDFDGKNPSIDLSDIIKESTKKRGLIISDLNINKDTRATKRYMLHYDEDDGLPLKIEVSLRDSAQFDEKDVRVIDGIRVYSIEKLAELKTEAFLHRIKARDIYDIGFLLHKHSDAIQPETLLKIKQRVKDFGLDYLHMTMKGDDIVTHYDTESIALSIDENIAKYSKLNITDDSYSVDIYAAEPDRVYRGKVIAIQDGQVIQEGSPGIATGHSADELKEITKADIGKNFTISYDKNGSVSIAQDLSRNRGNEIDR